MGGKKEERKSDKVIHPGLSRKEEVEEKKEGREKRRPKKKFSDSKKVVFAVLPSSFFPLSLFIPVRRSSFRGEQSFISSLSPPVHLEPARKKGEVTSTRVVLRLATVTV